MEFDMTGRIATARELVADLYPCQAEFVLPPAGEVDQAAVDVLARLAGHGIDLEAAVEAAGRILAADQDDAVSCHIHPYAEEEVDRYAAAPAPPGLLAPARDMLGLSEAPTEFGDGRRPEWTSAEEAALAAEILAGVMHLREADDGEHDPVRAVRGLIPLARRAALLDAGH